MPSDIERRAVGWLAASLRHFDPRNYERGDREGRLLARKATAELALLAMYRRRLDASPPSEDYLRIVDHIESLAARRSYRDLIARHHRSFWLYGLTYACLRTWGRADPELTHIVEQAIAIRYPVTRERMAHRQLDAMHLLEISGIRHPVGLCADAFPLTLLNGDPNLLELDEMDAYALTHTIYYATDFGLRPGRWPESFLPATAAELILALLRQYQIEGHTDLIAELIAACVCLGQVGIPQVDEGMEHLRQRQAPEGYIPAPSRRLSAASSDDTPGDEQGPWKNSHHATIVTALTCLMVKRARRDSNYPAQGYVSRRSPGRSVEPDLDRIRRAVRRAMTWLIERLPEMPMPVALTSATGLCIGATIPGSDARVSQSIRQTVARISDANPSAAWAVGHREHADLLRVWCLAAGLVGPALEVLSTEATAMTNPLPKPGLRSLNALASMIPGLSSAADRDERDIVERVAKPDAAGWVAAEMVRAFSQYRLGSTAIFLRAMVRLGAQNDRAARDAVEALLGQQRMDGSVGYLAADMDSDDAAVRPTWTVDFLWALVEFGGWGSAETVQRC